jgi:hypothetical protein
MHTVSTHRSISLKKFEDAPKVRNIGTPEIVSPYIEYKGDLVTESAVESHSFVFSIRRDDVAYRGDACPLTSVHKSVKLVSGVIAKQLKVTLLLQLKRKISISSRFLSRVCSL